MLAIREQPTKQLISKQVHDVLEQRHPNASLVLAKGDVKR